MKFDKIKANAFKVVVCLLSLSSVAYGQSKTDNIENGAYSVTPVVTKGYYSISNNAEKLNSSAGRLTFSNKVSRLEASERKTFGTAKKGYYSIGAEAGGKRPQMTEEGIDFSDKAPARVIQSNAFPVIKKGYYSIGNNAEKLQR